MSIGREPSGREARCDRRPLIGSPGTPAPRRDPGLGSAGYVLWWVLLAEREEPSFGSGGDAPRRRWSHDAREPTHACGSPCSCRALIVVVLAGAEHGPVLRFAHTLLPRLP